MARVAQFTDSLTRANGGLGANYSAELGAIQIVSNRGRQNALGGTPDYSVLVTGPTSPRQYVQVALPTYANNLQLLQLYTRYIGGATGNGYAWQFDGDLAQFYRLDNYSYTFIDQTALTLAATNTLLAVSDGSAHTLYRNGTAIVSYSDATYSAAGTVGWGIKADTSLANVEIDELEAGIVTSATFRALRGVGA